MSQGDEWSDDVAFATLDLSGAYRAVFDAVLPEATQVADPFHVVKLANEKLDETRRRVQNETQATGVRNTIRSSVVAGCSQEPRSV